MRFMKNYILSVKTSNSYLKKFEIAKFNLLSLSKDSKADIDFKSLRIQSGMRGKRNNSQ
jgi:hypothetical protein